MSILKVTKLGHPILRRTAKSVAIEEIPLPETQQFVDNMIETMNDYNGIGLAAPQVYDTRKIIVVGINPFHIDEYASTIVFNPKLTYMSEDRTVLE